MGNMVWTDRPTVLCTHPTRKRLASHVPYVIYPKEAYTQYAKDLREHCRQTQPSAKIKAKFDYIHINKTLLPTATLRHEHIVTE